MRLLASFGVAVALAATLVGCAGTTPEGTLSLRSAGLPPGMVAAATVDGSGHSWRVTGLTQALRLPPGRYELMADPARSSGWEYRPTNLRLGIEVRSGAVTKVTERYQIWPAAEPAGAAWSRVSARSPDSSKLQVGELACASENFCMAIGWDTNGPTGSDLYQWIWNGVSWSSAQDTDLGYTEVNGLSCPVANFCVMGTGSPQYAAPAAVDVWRGASWVSQHPAKPSQGSVILYTAACSSAVSCLAVAMVGGTVGSALAEQWNGQQWSSAAAPPTKSTAGVALVPWGLSCPFDGTANLCMLVSIPDGVGGPPVSLGGSVAIWRSGSWQSQNSVQDGGMVGCRGPSNCLVMGLSGNSTTTQAETTYVWDGRGWKANAAANGPMVFDDPAQCVSTTVCYVGGTLPSTSPAYVTQLLKWDGTSWRSVGSAMDSTGPEIVAPDPNLVACAPDDYCLDLGTAGTFALP